MQNTWSLINYFDVWGNEEDGWEVNNSAIEFDDLYLADDTTDEELVDYLKSIGFLHRNAKVSDFDIYSDGEIIEFCDADTLEPICCLRRNYN